MYLYNDKASVLMSSELYDTDDIRERVRNAKDITSVHEPVLHYSMQVTQILNECLSDMSYRFAKDLRRMAIFCLLTLIAKIGYTFYQTDAGFWITLWNSVKWTVPFLFVFYLGFAFMKHSATSFKAMVMIREGILGLSMCYDRVFTRPEMRQIMTSHTLEVQRDELIHDKGYLRAQMEMLVDSLPLAIYFGTVAKEGIREGVQRYINYILPQFNSIEHFDVNYSYTKVGHVPKAKP